MARGAAARNAGVIHERAGEGREVRCRVASLASRRADWNVIGGFGDDRRRTRKRRSSCMASRASHGCHRRMIHCRARERRKVTRGVTALAGRASYRNMIARQNCKCRRRHIREAQTGAVTSGATAADALMVHRIDAVVVRNRVTERARIRSRLGNVIRWHDRDRAGPSYRRVTCIAFKIGELVLRSFARRLHAVVAC